ncbi:hypothetical protein [Streptomyces goshikiensis]|uniref:hypothetical protein n=1 Tax=Streptomyces goshikiensis TaxID=1942 RepID=UPI0036DE996F
MYGEAGIACRPRDRQSISSLFGDWATSTEARFPTARHQRNHPFAAVPDYVSAAYAGVAVAIKPQ